MFIGIDIGGTKCAITKGFVKENGNIAIQDKIKLDTIKIPTHSVLELFAEKIREISNDSEIYAIGISCGGPLDSKKGVILSPPNLPGWGNIEIVKFLENEFNVPVGLQNDANACALAEWKFGAARGFNNVIFLTFGTGLGAGLILNGRLYSGTNDMAGEVGHVRLSDFGPVGYGKSGSFEGFCSGKGIAQIGKMKAIEKLQMGEKVTFCKSIAELDTINAKVIADYADKGDELAKEVYKISARKLGYGLSMLIDILNPEIIVIGSIFGRSHNLIWEHTEKIIKQEALYHSYKVCKVVQAQLSENLGDYAALSVSVNKYMEVK